MKLQIKMLNFVYIQGASINKWCIARFIWNTKVSNTYFSDESPYFSTLLKSAKELALLKLELQINQANVHKKHSFVLQVLDYWDPCNTFEFLLKNPDYPG